MNPVTTKPITYEIEQKYVVDDKAAVQQSLLRNGWQVAETQSHEDRYFNHPCKDFAATGEALRIRKVDGQAAVTYKAAKLPGSIKARRELEWSLGSTDADGQNMDDLLRMLDFSFVATVRKTREIHRCDDPAESLVVAVDTTKRLGVFVEIEGLLESTSGQPGHSTDSGNGQSREIELMRGRIRELAAKLGLESVQPLSYLRMLLAKETAGG